MPTVQIHMLDGHSLAEKRKLVKAMTDVISETLHVPKEYVNIIISEMTPEQNAVGGQLIKDIENTGSTPRKKAPLSRK